MPATQNKGVRYIYPPASRSTVALSSSPATRHPSLVTGFTLVEMLVAVAVLAIALGAMGVIFRMSMDAYRASTATAEVMRKLRAVTSQLDTDFKGWRRDGLTFFEWDVYEDPYYLVDYPNDASQLAHRYHRNDRMFFFADGDFQTYDKQTGKDAANNDVTKDLRGNMARVSYMLARDSDGTWPIYLGSSSTQSQRDERRRTRILARSQHIVTADPCFTNPSVAFPVLPGLAGRITTPALAEALAARNNSVEFDTDGLAVWADMPQEDFTGLPWDLDLLMMASACLGAYYPDDATGTGGLGDYGGLRVDRNKAQDVHLILCEGVNDFQIQMWDGTMWVPRTGYIDPVNRNITDTDFKTKADGTYTVIDTAWGYYYDIRQDSPFHPDALKFTFKLYDSRGFFKDGLTFTHIVYLGDNQ